MTINQQNKYKLQRRRVSRKGALNRKIQKINIKLLKKKKK